MSAVMTLPADVERVMQLKTVRDATARGHFLAGVREYGRDGSQFSPERLECLMRIEEHFHALLVYDQIEFLRGATPGTEDDRDFALNIQRICLEAANGFQRYLRHRNTWATSREGLDVMFRVTGLALNAIHSFVKWGYFLNEPGRSAPWKQLHALYLLADADGYSQVPFVLHPSQPSFKPTVQALYLRTLLLDVLHTGNLTKVQIEIADGWLSSWCSEYSLEAEYVPRRHLFFVDVASDSGMHLMRRDSQGDALRFVAADALKAQIAEVQAGLRHGRLYAGYGAGAVFPVEEHVALLAIVEKLYLALLSGDENRIEERTHFEDREVDVTVGIERVLRKVREDPSEARAETPSVAAVSMMDTIEITPSGLSLVSTDGTAGGEAVAGDAEIERWRVHDLSSKGFGLIVDRGAAETVLLNGLVGLRNQETGGWIVGSVVRKLANRVRGEMLVGIEVLAYRPIGVEIVSPNSPTPLTALYVPGTDGNGKLDALIVRAADFGRGNTFTLAAGGTRYRIRLNRMIKKGADWVLARFEIESKA